MSDTTPAPDDATCDRAWDEIMRIARLHALIVDAAGGIATLATPFRQRERGCRARVLRMHQMDETDLTPTEGR